MPTTKDFLNKPDDQDLGATWEPKTPPADGKDGDVKAKLAKTALTGLPEGSGKGGNTWKW